MAPVSYLAFRKSFTFPPSNATLARTTEQLGSAAQSWCASSLASCQGQALGLTPKIQAAFAKPATAEAKGRDAVIAHCDRSNTKSLESRGFAETSSASIDFVMYSVAPLGGSFLPAVTTHRQRKRC